MAVLLGLTQPAAGCVPARPSPVIQARSQRWRARTAPAARGRCGRARRDRPPRSNLRARYQGPAASIGQVGRGEDARRAAIGAAVVDVAQIVVHQPEPPRVDQDGLDQRLLGGDGAAIVRLDLRALAQEPRADSARRRAAARTRPSRRSSGNRRERRAQSPHAEPRPVDQIEVDGQEGGQEAQRVEDPFAAVGKPPVAVPVAGLRLALATTGCRVDRTSQYRR